MTEGSARFASRAAKELRREMLITPAAELGLVAMNGPNDPEPELVVENGRCGAAGPERRVDRE